MQIPPNRGHLLTEQVHEEKQELDLLSTFECVSLLSEDHQEAIRAVQRASNDIANFIDALVQKISNGGRLIYFGCGTSGRLGVLDAAECPPTFQSSPGLVIGLIAGGDASLRISSEAKEDDPDGIAPEFDRIKLTNQDTVLGIAAGGTTPWVLGGLEIAKKHSATTAFLTCSDISPKVDYLIQLKTGAEPLTGSTRLKAGTATKLTLNIITTTLFTKLGKVYGNLMVDLKATNSKLLDRAIRIVSTICEIDRETSAELLERATGDVKVAVLMHKKTIEATEARTVLDEVGGNLRAAL
ncbi:MAG: N-acetylmuramic acid 6-phosphate etherase [Phycisphaerales bacterium]|jgi:N-acetylmuramic acid 6-phosphate etherase|nr:N-acetylmuramic acid 6-phosphate etherase [Phycisphaerales bacterium]